MSSTKVIRVCPACIVKFNRDEKNAGRIEMEEWGWERVSCPICKTSFEPSWYEVVDVTLENPEHP